MIFLQRFWNFLASLLPPRRVLADDPTTRFIYAKGDFNVSRREVKSSAFLPEKPPQKLETSIHQIRWLSEYNIWKIGWKIGTRRGRNLRARADIKIKDVRQAGLNVFPDPWPSRHAVITGWPGYEKKSEQMQMANKLALAASLRLPDHSTTP